MEALAEAFLSGGARLLQVRAKDAPSGEFLDVTRRIVRRAHDSGARVMVNDRADIARMSGADGVHVGQDDLAVGAVRGILGPRALVGLSTHTPEQLMAAPDGADYVAIGPVFATATKETGYEARGLDVVRTAARLAGGRRLPLVAIGGITLERARDVLAAGASSVAVIGDLVTDDPAARVAAYLERLTV